MNDTRDNLLKSFDAEAARDHLIAGVKALAAAQGFSRVIVGISGGKDSTVTAAICARALGKENVFGLMMPDGRQSDLDDSKALCKALGIPCRVIDIGPMHEALRALTDQKGPVGEAGAFPIPPSRQADVNVGPRLRMTTLRYCAQALGARLVGTGNLSEATVGYCTKDGDTSCDFALLLRLTSLEVVAVGLTMPEIPPALALKTPADGLTGKSDEENMGLSYRDIHLYIREGTCGDPAVDAAIRAREKANAHKRRMPPVIDPFDPEGRAV